MHSSLLLSIPRHVLFFNSHVFHSCSFSKNYVTDTKSYKCTILRVKTDF